MNQQLFYYFNSFALQNTKIDALIIFCAENLILVLVIAFVLFHIFKFFYPKINERSHPTSKMAFQIIFVSLAVCFFVWGISQVVSFFYPSPRPFLVLNDVKSLFFHGGNDSFPSGHTTFIFTLAFMSMFYSKKIFPFLFVGAFIVGISRVMVGVHWPVDILGGIVLSFACALFARFLIFKKFLH